MTPTPTPTAARVSGTIKALYERACDLVRHEADCPARGRGDEYCKCDAVPFLNDFEALAAIQPDPEPQPVPDIVRSVWARCEALEDEADTKLKADIPVHDQGFWIGQKITAKSIRRSTEMPATPSSAGTVSVEAADWQPIETAPTDGKEFLILYSDGDVRAGRYLDNSHTSWPWKGVRPMYGAERAGNKITHWLPFPKPPALRALAGEGGR